jgi:hypothetical protein
LIDKDIFEIHYREKMAERIIKFDQANQINESEKEIIK